MAQILPVNIAAHSAESEHSELAAILSRLPEAWTILRDRRFDAGAAAPVAFTLIHPEIGVALIDRGAAPDRSAEALSALLEREAFSTYYEGFLPVVTVGIADDQVEQVGDKLAEAFEAAAPLDIADPDWADAVIELLLAPEALAEPGPEAAGAEDSGLVIPALEPTTRRMPDWTVDASERDGGEARPAPALYADDSYDHDPYYEAAPRRRWPLLAAGAAAVVLLGGVVGAVSVSYLSGDDNKPSETAQSTTMPMPAPVPVPKAEPPVSQPPAASAAAPPSNSASAPPPPPPLPGKLADTNKPPEAKSLLPPPLPPRPSRLAESKPPLPEQKPQPPQRADHPAAKPADDGAAKTAAAPRPEPAAPAESKPPETKQAEAKPPETKPAETKPSETKQAEAQPPEEQPAPPSPPPSPSKTAEQKPAPAPVASAEPPPAPAAKPAESKPSEHTASISPPPQPTPKPTRPIAAPPRAKPAEKPAETKEARVAPPPRAAAPSNAPPAAKQQKTDLPPLDAADLPRMDDSDNPPSDLDNPGGPDNGGATAPSASRGTPARSTGPVPASAPGFIPRGGSGASAPPGNFPPPMQLLPQSNRPGTTGAGPNTGQQPLVTAENGGRAEPTRNECRPYTASTTVTGIALPVRGMACRGADGNWHLVSEVPLR